MQQHFGTIQYFALLSYETIKISQSQPVMEYFITDRDVNSLKMLLWNQCVEMVLSASYFCLPLESLLCI